MNDRIARPHRTRPLLPARRTTRHRLPALLAGLAGLVAMAGAAPKSRPSDSGPTPVAPATVFAGTWTGTSLCTGVPGACKDETVVYRFEPVAKQPRQLRMLGDKIIAGKRLPMGALLMECDTTGRSLRCEFTTSTHIVWAFTAFGDSLAGTLITLPDSTLGRRVTAHRVPDSAVPPAPAREDYGPDRGAAH